MKTLLILLSLVLLQQPAFAEKDKLPDEADYVVPTTPELVPYSRFKIKIVAPYTGDFTNSISYIFPAELTGVENQEVRFQRVGASNTWDSPEMTAVCTEYSKTFSCNVNVKKVEEPIVTESNVQKSAFFQLAQARGCGGGVISFNARSEFTGTFIDEAMLTGFLKNKGVSDQQFDAQMSVAKAFACSEPIGGILSYEFK